ncbi:MAG: hypothetical protein IKF16_08540 [Lachnospiraceae bacterium]|nr:hypothetical protein [Eubacterium sp.]MBR3166198.1 hypothetical protein [Lachnospiraceae bacterium]
MTTEITFMKKHPELAAEWSEKNFPHRAEDERAHSKEKRWWKCSVCGNEWQAETVMRAHGKCRCPYCHNRKLLKGFNDLESRFPEIAAEWDYEKNGGLKPDEVVYGTNRVAWWKCAKGHSWSGHISFRTLKGAGCPYCSREEAVKGENDLATIYPDLAGWWSEKNKWKADEVKWNYPSMVWWLCPVCGSEYKSRIRVQHELGADRCPYCRGKYVRKGINDIATTDPWLLEEWDHDHNIGIKPDEIARTSERSVRWKCSKGHEWGATVRERIVEKKGCPYCSGELKARTQKENADMDQTETVMKTEYIQGMSNQDSLKELPAWEKYALGIQEASDYFVISRPKLREIVRNDPEAEYLTWSGGNAYFIREEFEKYLDGQKNLPLQR